MKTVLFHSNAEETLARVISAALKAKQKIFFSQQKEGELRIELLYPGVKQETTTVDIASLNHFDPEERVEKILKDLKLIK